MHCSAAVNEGDEADDGDSCITDRQTPVFGTADDEPLILTASDHRSKCQRVYGIFLMLIIVVNWSP